MHRSVNLKLWIFESVSGAIVFVARVTRSESERISHHVDTRLRDGSLKILQRHDSTHPQPIWIHIVKNTN